MTYNLNNGVKVADYNLKSQELDIEINDINGEIAKFKGADSAYQQDIEGFLTFCNEAPALFKSSRPALKRELLRFVVSNLNLWDGRVDFSLKVPFNIVAKYSQSENWQARQVSNLRPSVLETDALPAKLRA